MRSLLPFSYWRRACFAGVFSLGLLGLPGRVCAQTRGGAGEGSSAGVGLQGGAGVRGGSGATGSTAGAGSVAAGGSGRSGSSAVAASARREVQTGSAAPSGAGASASGAGGTVVVPLGGNAWVVGPHVSARIGDRPLEGFGAGIDTTGLTGWDDATTTVQVWFHLSHTGKLHLQLECEAADDKAVLGLQLAGQHRNLAVGTGVAARNNGAANGATAGKQPGSDASGTTASGEGSKASSATAGKQPSSDASGTTASGEGSKASSATASKQPGSDASGTTASGEGSDGATAIYDAGEWTITDTGYQQLIIRGVRKTGRYFANIRNLLLHGPAAAQPVAYVPNNEGNFFHWGRRGPSVHFGFPTSGSIEWFYNEVTVPQGQDVIGSYFMADGFSYGYFGMQVNSATERRLLFSVWSPYNTDDPTAIPDSLRIKLLAKGEGVHTGAFGNEGSGGQSYLVYPWKAGETYRFLIRAVPAGNYTDFTAWYASPEDKSWHLLASWRRPSTHTWLTGLHSFLENFEPDNGNQQRSVLFNHQWVCDNAGHWTQLFKARFTVDNTGRKGYRLDYDGGVKGAAFFLHNGGFFNKNTPPNTWFQRPQDMNAQPPVLPE